MRNALIYSVLALVAGVTMIGCDKSETPVAEKRPVVIYSSIDEPYLRPIIEKFEKQTGIDVEIVTDTEATKTTGLAARIEAEANAPRADVYWGNEIFHTVNLADKKLFKPYRPTTAQDVPQRWRDAQDRYVDIGLRARVITFSTAPDAADAVKDLRSIDDLARPTLKDKIALCNVGVGTASGHMAVLYTKWGEEKYVAWLKAIKANGVKLVGGNSVVTDMVGSGTMLAGLTDNDDVANAKAAGAKLDGTLPDQGPDGIGTLLLPTSVALVNNGPNEAGAKRLIDYLAAADVERGLIEGRYLAYSVRDASTGPKPIDVDFAAAAKNMKHAVELALTILQER